MTTDWNNAQPTPIEDIRAARKIMEDEVGFPCGSDQVILYPWQRKLLGLPDNTYSVTRDKFIELCNIYFRNNPDDPPHECK